MVRKLKALLNWLCSVYLMVSQPPVAVFLAEPEMELGLGPGVSGPHCA